MIFQKTNLKYLLSFLSFGLFLVVLLGFTNNSCSVEHVLISGEIYSYEKSLDPESCENILEKIDLYNDQCRPEIEILDCG
ncbi:MAG: hypothetical protein K5777_00275 [Nitrosopumilus sp.]|nr:hypothetical protein [Nitrosopumilus sp.]